jgi:excisionase family DNA binding protein
LVILDGEEYLTGDEAADLLGVKPATLYAYVSRGLVQSYRQGIKRRRLYRRADLERFARIAPSETRRGERRGRPHAPRRLTPHLPPAESWIND